MKTLGWRLAEREKRSRDLVAEPGCIRSWARWLTIAHETPDITGNKRFTEVNQDEGKPQYTEVFIGPLEIVTIHCVYYDTSIYTRTRTRLSTPWTACSSRSWAASKSHRRGRRSRTASTRSGSGSRTSRCGRLQQPETFFQNNRDQQLLYDWEVRLGVWRGRSRQISYEMARSWTRTTGRVRGSCQDCGHYYKCCQSPSRRWAKKASSGRRRIFSASTGRATRTLTRHCPGLKSCDDVRPPSAISIWGRRDWPGRYSIL